MRSQEQWPTLHISASALQTLQACPRQFAFRYLLGVPREDIPSSMLLGSAVHRGLQCFYEAMRDGNPEPDLDDLVRLAALVISKAVVGDTPIALAEGETPAGLVDEASRLLNAFLANPFRPRRVLAVEQRFTIQPIHPATGEVPEYEEVIIGFFDLVCENDDGDLLVVDAKTSKRCAPPKAANLDLQAGIYVAAAESIFDRQAQIHHLILTRTQTPRVALHEIPRTPGDAAEAVEAAWSGLELIRLAVSHPDPLRLLGRVRSWRCGGCSWRARCSSSSARDASIPAHGRLVTLRSTPDAGTACPV